MFSYTPSFIPNKILIVGCGGTGSRLVPLLAQFIKTCAWVAEPSITLIDDDIVEEKNLLRQNFISVDVGKSKAEVLANRYSKAFNINISAIKERVSLKKNTKNTDMDTVDSAFYNHRANSIIILCVDSPESRREILTLMVKTGVGGTGSVLLLDSGNENDFGQVSISTLTAADIGSRSSSHKYIRELPNAIPGDIGIPCIPINIPYFRDMKAVSAGSCADLDQTMAINVMMATTMFGIIQNFYYAKPISYHRIDISLSHGSTPHYMNTEFIKSRTTDSDRSSFDGYYLGSCNIEKPIGDFYNKVYLPFKILTEKAAAPLSLGDEKGNDEVGEEEKRDADDDEWETEDLAPVRIRPVSMDPVQVTPVRRFTTMINS